MNDVDRESSNGQATRLLAAIVQSSEDAIISKTLEGRVTSWNKAAERIFGYTAGEMLGQPISLLAPTGRVDEMRRILDRIGEGGRVDHYETERRRKDGKIIQIALTVSPIRDQAGRVVGASKIARDITEAKLAASALSERGASALDPRYCPRWYGRHRRARHHPVLQRHRRTDVQLYRRRGSWP
jgi:PAS domain S-box-containing protein